MAMFHVKRRSAGDPMDVPLRTNAANIWRVPRVADEPAGVASLLGASLLSRATLDLSPIRLTPFTLFDRPVPHLDPLFDQFSALSDPTSVPLRPGDPREGAVSRETSLNRATRSDVLRCASYNQVHGGVHSLVAGRRTRRRGMVRAWWSGLRALRQGDVSATTAGFT